MKPVAVPAPDEIRGWPATVDLPTAGRCFGAGRDLSYQLAREGRFPVPVLGVGRRLVVTRASLLAVLGIPDNSEAGVPTPAIAQTPSKGITTSDQATYPPPTTKLRSA